MRPQLVWEQSLLVETDGEQKPAAFFSRQLHGAQQRYSAQKLEGLALYEAITHFAFYLYGKRFIVVTDHKSLETLMTAWQYNKRLLNWSMILTDFDFEMKYHKGSRNVVADCLSRGFDLPPNADSKHQQDRQGGDVGKVT